MAEKCIHMTCPVMVFHDSTDTWLCFLMMFLCILEYHATKNNWQPTREVPSQILSSSQERVVVSARGGGPQGLPFNEVNPSYTADQDVWGSSLSLSCVLRTCWCMVISKNDPTESCSRKSGLLNGLKPRWSIRSTRYLLKGLLLP